MLWILQTNFYSEPGYLRLVEALERLELPHQVVKPVPFSDRLIPADIDTSTSKVDIEDLPDVEIDTAQRVITCGSYTLAKIAAKRGWQPGAFIENLSYDVWSKAWKPIDLLNPNARVAKLGDAEFDEPSMFVRPVEDSKSFSGKVFERGEFLGWKKLILERTQPSDPLNADTEVIISKPVEIYTETRLFVVGGEIVTASGYRRGGKVIYSDQVDDEVFEFGRQCVETWIPNLAFVLDIAQTPEGCKVIELNCLNAAGFYACDTMKLVTALEELDSVEAE